MANIIITGGAGFMGRWVAKNLVDKGHRVWILDNLSNSTEDNIEEFRDRLADFVNGDIKDKELLVKLFKNNFDICIHLAAAINVQESIDNPEKHFNNNVRGTFHVLDECRKHRLKIVFISSALIYEMARRGQAIEETHPLNPACPYTVSKIFGEELAISYYKTYNLPMVILRPFSIYGPWQRCDSEGGVMSVFINRMLNGKPVEVFGDGEQGRDFFYIEDCAEFIVKAAFSDKAIGRIFNAGYGREVKINDLAKKIAGGKVNVTFIRHPHPHVEIINMCADSTRAKEILQWEAKTSLAEGIKKTTEWLKAQKHILNPEVLKLKN
jgi:nucleoside-diphosphate-sugar epimerase